MGALIAFLGSGVGRIVLYALGALLASGLIWAAVAHYDGLVKRAAVLERENLQYQQTIRDRDEYIKHTEAIIAFQGASIDILQKNVEATQEKYKTLEDYLNSKEAQASDRQSSEVLKTTVRKLKGLQ